MRLVSGIAVVVFLQVVAGCGSQAAKTPVVHSAPAERIVGRWEGTMQIDEEAIRSTLPAEQVDAALASLRAMRMQMDFRKDGSLVLSGEERGRPYESKATWEVVSEEGEKLTLKSVEKSDRPEVSPREETIDVRFEDNDSFVMPLSTEKAELGSLQFKRLR